MELEENPVEELQDTDTIPEVFLYVNVLTGKHAKTRDSDKLAVFKNDMIGRQWEQKSNILKGMVGYWAAWKEMIDIAKNQTGGQYEYFGTAD
jgi:hypothetical protein